MKSATSTRFYLLASLLFVLAIVMIGVLISTNRASINSPDPVKAINAVQNGANSAMNVNTNGPLSIYGGQNKVSDPKLATRLASTGAASFSLGDRDPHYTPVPYITPRLSGGGR